MRSLDKRRTSQTDLAALDQGGRLINLAVLSGQRRWSEAIRRGGSHQAAHQTSCTSGLAAEIKANCAITGSAAIMQVVTGVYEQSPPTQALVKSRAPLHPDAPSQSVTTSLECQCVRLSVTVRNCTQASWTVGRTWQQTVCAESTIQAGYQQMWRAPNPSQVPCRDDK